MDDQSIKEMIRRALAGDEAAQNWLVRTLTPVIQRRVARMLLLRRRGPAAGRDIRQEVEDFTQDTFLVLFADDGKVLRSWEPERGLSFQNFFGLVAERVTASILRSGKRSPWKEDPTLPEDLDQATTESGPDPEQITASREQWRLLLDRLTEELSPLGWHLFDLLFLQDLPIEEVMRQTNMTADAIYAWRSRLRRLACRLLKEMSEAHAEQRIAWRGRKL
jgi:RNA polymerase sigma-70 factor, ECF subfamily